ncbi:MAG: FAD:protein FMN transferase [Terrimesophilobacter sp.]
MRDVFSSMGTVVSAEWAPALAPILGGLTIEDAFAELEERFSLYRPESELSRIARGELNMTHASEQLRSVYEEALGWRTQTEGTFTPHRPDGVIDLNGIVKALAIRRAGAVFESVGVSNWSINAGGDLLYGQDSLPSTIGIVDPNDRSRLLCSV